MFNNHVFKNNTKTVTCTVTGLADLVGYTGTLTVKKSAKDTAALFTITGSIVGLVR